jgi:4-amino-4-deoxy-L-arabinose transferase-like glycosyltransferase
LVISGQKFPYDYWRDNAGGKVVNNQWQVGWHFIYEVGNNADTLIQQARLPIMLLTLLFGLVVYFWGKEFYGKKAGLFALVLFVFNTSILGHSHFVTTDLGISFAFFLNMYLVWRFLKDPNWKKLLLAGLGFGLVMVTKFSAAVIAPTLIIVWIMLAFKKGEGKPQTFLQGINSEKWYRRLGTGFVAFAVVAVIGVLTMWAFYVPHTINMPAEIQKQLIAESNVGPLTGPLQSMSDSPILKPLGQWALGFTMVASHVEGGHDAFLLGQVSNKGWWYYYPVTIALKTQIALFILIILSFVFWKKTDHRHWFDEAFLWVLPLVLLAMGMQGSINLGIRYMLPIYAFIFISVSKLAGLWDPKQFAHLWQNGTKAVKGNTTVKAMTIILALTMGWYVLAGILAYPYYMAYFNEFVGGYKNGDKYLTDSNLDWGQDNKRLAEWAEKNNIDKIYVDVFPGPMPAKYYLGDRMVEWHVQSGRPKGYFAVSATFYRSSVAWKKANNNMDYTWLEGKTPVANIGGSIKVYDLR